jgi:fructose-specific component phosphotransferase system IIB-like protein
MRKEIKILFTLFLLIVALAVGAQPIPAYAALGITSIVPSTVLNNAPATLTITGSDFTSDAVVLLDGYGALATTFLNSGTLTATVPAGLPAGTYTVTVRISDVLSTSCSGCLTVVEPTPIPPFGRPQVVLKTYRVNVGEIKYGEKFNLVVRLKNVGQSRAYNLQAVFTSSDLIPMKNGGVEVIGDLNADSGIEVGQQMTAAAPLYGKSAVVVDMSLTYYDEKGAAYSEKFTLSIPVASSGGYVVAATATPTGLRRSQLVITDYKTDVELLQPGVQFTLNLTVQNVGNLAAKAVTMIVGGGSASSSGGETPQPGGVSAGGGEFTNFAPVGTSNVQSLGDVGPGATLQAAQKLIVNVSTNPGAYPMKITFSYLDAQGNMVNDEQVITLLVYNLPNVDIGFYQPVTSLMAGQPNSLPIQVVNLGKSSVVLGNLKIEASNGVVENNSALVGALDVGGYFTTDAMITPETVGSVDLTVTIEYVDDFNQPRQISKVLTLDVVEGEVFPGPMPNDGGSGGSGEIPPLPQETFLQKIWRFILGLLGLDSGQPGGVPTESPATPAPLPLPGPGGKG